MQIVKYTYILSVMFRLNLYYLLIMDEMKTKTDDILPTIIIPAKLFNVLLFGCVMAGFFLLIIKKFIKVKPKHRGESNKLSANSKYNLIVQQKA